jgi:hypothetical protein
MNRRSTFPLTDSKLASGGGTRSPVRAPQPATSTIATREQTKASRTVIAEALPTDEKAQARNASRALAEGGFSLGERVELGGAESHRLVKLDADLVRPQRGSIVG